MFSKLFNKKSRNYKEFESLIETYKKLLLQKSKEEDKNLIAMIEIQMLNATQALGVNLRKWKEDPEFQKEFQEYVQKTYETKKNSGLPASADFVRQNEVFLKEVLSNSIKEEERTFDIRIISEDIKKNIKKIQKILKDLNKLYNLKRRMRMKPATGIKNIYLNVEGYEELIKEGYFSKEEIEKMVKKLNRIKDNLFDAVEKETVSPEFFKRERELFFHKSLIGNSFSEFIDTFYEFIYSESYYLTIEDNKFYRNTDLRSFKRLTDLEKELIKYEEE